MAYEKFKAAGAKEVYRRSREKGRMLPQGLNYVSSWVDLEFSRCFQLMETEDFSLFSKWTSQWRDLVEFEIIPVRTSAEAMTLMEPTL
jgi:hypothetical protein